MKKIIVLAVCMLAIAATVNAYKILVLVPANEETNWNFMQIIIDELINRGHEITCITSQTATFGFLRIQQNYTEILIDPPFEVQPNSVHEDVAWFHKKYSSIWVTATVAAQSAAWSLTNKRVDKFIRRTDLHFDLVINDDFYHESWLMFGRKFNAPIITIATTGMRDFLDRNMGMVTPYSHVGHPTLGYDEEMTFAERWCNTLFSLITWFYHDFIHLPVQNQVAQKIFSGHLRRLPSVQDLIRNVSLTLVNTHPMLWPPRPSMPTLIYIGGAHLKKPKPLPKELHKFIDDALDGVIFVSLEQFLDMSTVLMFFAAFASLEQRVLWQYDNSSLDNVPPNVLIYTDVPRYDILNDPNVILFISNTDFFESLYYSVPILMMPSTGDKMLMAKRIEHIGCGLEYNVDVTIEYLQIALNELIKNQNYTNEAIKMGVILRKDIVHPLDRAMYWIDYVVRHKGAKHLQSYGVHVTLSQYLQWEFFVPILLALILGTSAVMYFSIKKFLIIPA